MICICIIEDDHVASDFLCSLIRNTPGMELSGVYRSAEDALLGIAKSIPDVVLCDLHLPGMNGIECIRQLTSVHHQLLCMVVSVSDDDEHVFQALEAGAVGYIVKHTHPARILDSIVELTKGGSPMSSHIARKVVQRFRSKENGANRENLSSRESEILDLLEKGLRYKEIGKELFISTETVRTHVRNIYEKLQVNSRTEAINKVYRR